MNPDRPDPSPRFGATWDVVCCSLEPWDQVWRRNQFLAAELIERRTDLRLLFVEPPVDVAWSLLRGRRLDAPGLRPVGESGRFWALRPIKILPRRLSGDVDRRLCRAVQRCIRRLGFRDPTLWINDNTYAELPRLSGCPSVYDVTDDWTLAGPDGRDHDRQVANDARLIESADEVVVCSSDLRRSRGASRPVHLIPNAVDVERFRTPQSRPADLPPGPVVLYSGTLSEERLDVDLCIEMASTIRGQAILVLVGPNSCDDANTERLRRSGAQVLGARPYSSMPGYLQHADVLVVPHVVTPFTESLDPIKAREFQAVGRPVVSTPVAGFRDLPPPVVVAEAEEFVSAVVGALYAGVPPGPGELTACLPSWADRATEFLAVLESARSGAGSRR